MKRHEIKAKVMWYWDNPQCKFQPGDYAKVKVGGPRHGQIGIVKAVTCTRIPDGNGGFLIRAVWRDPRNDRCSRMFTKYYLVFEDGEYESFHSHYLTKVALPGDEPYSVKIGGVPEPMYERKPIVVELEQLGVDFLKDIMEYNKHLFMGNDGEMPLIYNMDDNGLRKVVERVM